MRTILAMPLCLAALVGCGLSEADYEEASEAATSAVLAQDIAEEAKKTQDFDAIAKETVAEFDTTGLDVLTE